MKNLIGLFDALCDTYDRTDFHPNPDGSTHCNQAVQAVARAMGCMQLQDKSADQIMAFLESSQDWSDVPMQKAQDMANEGSFLIAGLQSVDLHQPHGHVVVIRPGKPCYSGKWGETPRCLNIGEHDFIARAQSGPLTMSPVGINEAFVPLPKIYVWRPSL